ncbi:22522_t:CDS:1, partial [Rhizophagus irregularis]
ERQPIKKPVTVLTIPKPFRFHARKRSNEINKYFIGRACTTIFEKSSRQIQIKACDNESKRTCHF